MTLYDIERRLAFWRSMSWLAFTRFFSFFLQAFLPKFIINVLHYFFPHMYNCTSIFLSYFWYLFCTTSTQHACNIDPFHDCGFYDRIMVHHSLGSWKSIKYIKHFKCMKFSMMLMAWPGHHDDQDNKPNPEEDQPDHRQNISYSCQVQNWT